MNWTDEIKRKKQELDKAVDFVETQLGTIFGHFLELAEAAADKANDELFEGKRICKVDTHEELYSGFAVYIYESPMARMSVDLISREKYIEVIRVLDTSPYNDNILPETIVVTEQGGKPKITFEREQFSGKRNTSKIDDEFLSRMLVEPVVRSHFELEQENYYKLF